MDQNEVQLKDLDKNGKTKFLDVCFVWKSFTLFHISQSQLFLTISV